MSSENASNWPEAETLAKHFDLDGPIRDAFDKFCREVDRVINDRDNEISELEGAKDEAEELFKQLTPVHNSTNATSFRNKGRGRDHGPRHETGLGLGLRPAPVPEHGTRPARGDRCPAPARVLGRPHGGFVMMRWLERLCCFFDSLTWEPGSERHLFVCVICQKTQKRMCSHIPCPLGCDEDQP